MNGTWCGASSKEHMNTVIVSETIASCENGKWKKCVSFAFNTLKVISCRVHITELHLEDSKAIKKIIIIIANIY